MVLLTQAEGEWCQAAGGSKRERWEPWAVLIASPCYHLALRSHFTFGGLPAFSVWSIKSNQILESFEFTVETTKPPFLFSFFLSSTSVHFWAKGENLLEPFRAGGSSVSSSSQRSQDCNCPWPASHPWVQSGKGGHITHIRKPDAFLNKCIIYAIRAQKLSLSTHYSPKSSCHQQNIQGKPREKNNLLLNLKTLYMHQEQEKAF